MSAQPSTSTGCEFCDAGIPLDPGKSVSEHSTYDIPLHVILHEIRGLRSEYHRANRSTVV
jgi:hypothetical protein